MNTDRLFLGGAGVLMVAGMLLLAAYEDIGGLVKPSDQPGPGISEEEACYAWFDRFGFPDLSHAAFVKVATGQWYQTVGDGDESPRSSFVYGFLLRDGDTTFDVFTLDLTTRRFERTSADLPEYEQVGYKEYDLKAAVGGNSGLLAWLTPRFRRNPPHVLELFVLSRVCASRGLIDEARQLFQLARNCLPTTDDENSIAFPQYLSDQMADKLFRTAVIDMPNPAVSRKELLRRFEAIERNCPEPPEKESILGFRLLHPRLLHPSKQAGEYAGILQRMVAEDEEHTEDGADDEELTPQEQIAELIFQLRDQTGSHCWSAYDFFAKGTPAHQLVEAGYDAVPQLIDALEDERFTRMVARACFISGPVHASPTILRVGDCCLIILERISGRTFYNGIHMSGDGQTVETKKKVQAWWAEFQEKGEERMLVEATAAGTADGLGQARMLVERYPSASLTALRSGIEHAKDPEIRAALVAVASVLPGPEADALLRDELNGMVLPARVEAAQALLRRGSDEGIAPMIEAWHKTGAEDRSGASRLVPFLVRCGDPEAISALGKNLRQRPLDLRIEIIGRLTWALDEPAARPSPALLAARDRVLVEALSDIDIERGTGTRYGKTVRDPRVCDLAGHLLSQAWGQPDLFDLSAPEQTRDRQRIELANLWRCQEGLEPLPLPVND